MNQEQRQYAEKMLRKLACKTDADCVLIFFLQCNGQTDDDVHVYPFVAHALHEVFESHPDYPDISKEEIDTLTDSMMDKLMRLYLRWLVKVGILTDPSEGN